MTDESSDPVLSRVRATLRWPAWEDWHHQTGAVAPVEPVLDRTVPDGAAPQRADHETRGSAVRRRLDLARTIDSGGPYLEVFRNAVLERLDREQRGPLGPLAGFTFAIKDLVAVEGHPVRAGSAVRHDAGPEPVSAPIVRQLEALGAVAIGIVTLHEFAFGVTGVNEYAGTAVNPKAPDRIPGGSSSGSAAAVADGSARISIGTDTGGSVRLPASFCGVVGFKPSFGRYPSAGVFPLSGTLDHVGLFATTVQDIITTHGALGHPVGPVAAPRRIGVAREDLVAADPEVRAAVEQALTSLRDVGIETVDVTMPAAEHAFATSTAIMFSEAAAIHAAPLEEHPERYGADIKARLELGRSLRSTEVATAHEFRRRLQAQVLAVLDDVDCIVGPTTPMVAPPLDQAADPALPPRAVANSRLGNVVGLPAISLPLAGTSAPVGLQLMGATDADLLAHAAAVAELID